MISAYITDTRNGNSPAGQRLKREVSNNGARLTKIWGSLFLLREVEDEWYDDYGVTSVAVAY